jgi:hypothetical protein
MSDLKIKIEKANGEALERMVNSQPMLVDVKKAIDVVPGLKDKMVMHAGPPITWDRMCFPQKNAIKGAIVYERWAKDLDGAEALVTSGNVKFGPCHEHNAVGPMAGIESPSMPVFVVRNEAFGNEAYCIFYEGPQVHTLACGCFDEGVLLNLKWLDEVVAPVFAAVLEKTGPLNLKAIISKALTMGDEMHSRNTAATALFSLEVAPSLINLDFNRAELARVADYLRRTEQFFVHLAMAASKVTADAAHGIEYSTVVTAIARNGVDVGIKVSGLPGAWFTGPAGPVEGVYYGGHTVNDAQSDMGDSAITETTGLGGFAHAASPSLGLTKGDVEMAFRYTREMQEICVGNNPNYGIPYLGGQGSPTGIDIRSVVEKRILPVCNTGIAHRRGGKIGVGTSRAPLEAFSKALVAFGARYKG